MPAYKDKKRNTWYVSFKLKDANGNFKNITKRGFDTKHDALVWESKQKLDSDIAINRATFRNILELQFKSIDSSSTTIYMKTHYLEKHFPYIDTPLYKISRKQFLDWRNDLKDSGLATRTLNRGIGYVKSVCAFAYKVYGIPDNSVVLNSFKLQHEDKKEMDVWNPQEFNTFIEYVAPKTYQLFFKFLYWSGCRRGEAIALCKEDIQGNKVNISKTMRYAKYGFKKPKTDSSIRSIQIDDELLKELQPLIERANPFIFGGEHPLSTTYIEKTFKKGIELSGVKPIRIHDLRHSHATLLINHGVNIVAVSKRLGHSTIEQTLKTYTHLLEKTNDEMMDIIEDIKCKK